MGKLEGILAKAKAIHDEMVEDYKYLHKCPGIGFEIRETYEYVKNRLVEIGYNPVRCGKSGIIVDIGNDDGKTILLRADMDGLDIKEEADVEYASTNGKMQACGHDMHTAMLLGAARILKDYEINLKGRVRLMFQPAEEILEGAKDMIKAGVLDNPKVEAGVMIHVMTALPFECGTVIVSSPGVSAPAADYFSININGIGGHGASPEKCVDPLNIAAHILLSLQNINARELASGTKATITIGSINSGNAYNVIPDKVVMRGTMRTYDEKVRDLLKSRIVEMATNTANVFKGNAIVTFDRGCPTLVNDENLSCHIEKTMIELLDNKKVFTTKALSDGKESRSSGSEDFAYISHRIPTIMLGLVAGQYEKGYEYNIHHPKVKFDLDALVYGSAVYVGAALSLL